MNHLKHRVGEYGPNKSGLGRKQWRALLNTTLDLRFPQNMTNFLTS